MWNAGNTPARMIEVISPPGFDAGSFQEVADINETGPPDPARVAALAAQAGLEMAEPHWLTDVVDRYHLTPPPTG